MAELAAAEQAILDGLLASRPDLAPCREPLLAVHEALVQAYDAGRKFLVCGNGGSYADALHIVGELCKSFLRKRPVPPEMATNLEGLPWGEELAQHLEAGLSAIALGANGALNSATENDSPLRAIAFAQETYALAKKGDVFMAISTSGGSANCLMAQSVAKAVGCTTVALTGPGGGKLAVHADVAIKAPGDSTPTIQEAHVCLYHAMCAMIEAHYFPVKR